MRPQIETYTRLWSMAGQSNPYSRRIKVNGLLAFAFRGRWLLEDWEEERSEERRG